MKTENWVRTETNSEYKKRALKLIHEREKWEKEQIKKGKKEVKIPHPEIKNTFIIKYV